MVAKCGPPQESVAGKDDSVSEQDDIRLKITLEEGAAPAPITDSKDDSKDAPPPNAGAGAKWRVKGGDFKFRVSSVFAISSASLETANSVDVERQIVKHKDDNPPKEFPDEKSLENAVARLPDIPLISSIPMDVREKDNSGQINITSPLYIRISRENVPDSDLDELYPSGWQPEFVVHQVPSALWGDPNQPPDRMNADNSTIGHQMAVSVAAPLPILSMSKIPAINATDIQRQKVMEKPLAKTETQSTMTAKASIKIADWSAVKTSWTDAVTKNQETADALVTGIMSTLGWDTPAPDVVTMNLDVEPKPWMLKQKLPERLISGTKGAIEGVVDGLDAFYLALPRVVAA